MVRLYMRQVSLFKVLLNLFSYFQDYLQRLQKACANAICDLSFAKESKWQETFLNVLTQTGMVRISSGART